MRPRVRKSFVLLSALIVMSCNPPADPDAAQPATSTLPTATAQSELGSRVTAFVDDTMVRFEIPGFTVGIVRGGELVYTGAFGVTNVETREPLTPKMDLDAPVTTYLPYFELAGAIVCEATMSVRQRL